ncbi:MAG: hypothetical protein OHK0054_10490 [Sideroxydans sp.]
MAKAGAGNGGGAQKSKAFAGLIVGMMLGIVVTGLVVWYVLTSNTESFHPAERHEPPQVVAPQVVVPNAPASAAVAVPGVAPTYEFYKVLPGKGESPSSPAPPAAGPTTSKPAVGEPYLVQVGSFARAEDAEKLKAKLALLGFEASVQRADVPGKGVFHRVRLGPYSGLTEAHAAIASLKQNGIANATAVHAK